jgi:L-histidine Nalpha-methyltransferase
LGAADHTRTGGLGLLPASFEDPRHVDRVLRHMREGVVPLKYAYAGSAAYRHDALARTAGYAEVIGEARHEVHTLTRISPLGVPRQIAEIGPGNGVHSAALLDALRDAVPNRWRYLGLDFSATLLSLALPCIAETFPQLDRAAGLWDLEAGRTSRISAWRQGPEPVLICMLGHTLGNLEDPVQALRNLALSVRSGDLLLLSITLMAPGADESAVLNPYLNDTFNAAVLEPLRAATREGASMSLRVRLADRTVVAEATLLEPASVGGFEFEEQATVRCFASARFLPEEALGLVSEAGWHVLGSAVDESGSHLAVVARR